MRLAKLFHANPLYCLKQSHQPCRQAYRQGSDLVINAAAERLDCSCHYGYIA